MWRFEYPTISLLRTALSSARARAEADLAARRAFSSFKARGPVLYIVYLRRRGREGSEPGPFPITAPYEWPRIDFGSLKVVIEAAFSLPSAQAIYAHYLLSAKTRSGQLLSPAGRVDLLIGRRIATPLRRRASPPLQTIDPVLFYEDSE